MPDSLQVISVDPAMELQLLNVEAAFGETAPVVAAPEVAAPQARRQSIADTVAALRTAPPEPAPRKGIMLVAHKEPQMPVSPRAAGSPAISWVIIGLVALFLLVSMRYRNNFKFMRGMRRDILSSRPKNAMFQDTVRETSFLVLLNLLCIASAGVLLFGAIELEYPPLRDAERWYEALGLVAALAAAFYAWQWAVLFIAGQIFTDRKNTRLWLRGLGASHGMLSMVLFPLALMSIFYSRALPVLVIVGAVAYILTRLLFVCKGFRIFASDFSSYLLFFYYLCSVEIAPLIFLYTTASSFCKEMLS